MTDISFNDVPKILGTLSSDVVELKQMLETLLQGLNQNQTSLEHTGSEWLSLDALCKYLPDLPSKHTVYKHVSQLSIPFHKSEKKLRFNKKEIDAWLLEGSVKTQKQSFSDYEQSKKVSKPTFQSSQNKTSK